MNEYQVHKLVIPGYENRIPKLSPRAPLRRLSETVRAIGLEPRILRAPDGRIEQVDPDIPGATGKAQIVENWLNAEGVLPEGNNIRVSGEGHVNEFVSQDILHVLARDFIGIEGKEYGVRPAPYALDPTDKLNRGGDLLLEEYDKDGIPQAICLIDIKLTPPRYYRENGREAGHPRKLKSGMNRKLGYPIPAIVVFVGDILIEQQTGEKITLRNYVGGPVYTMARQDSFESFLPGISRPSQQELFQTFRERIHQACLATKQKIKITAENKNELNAMLYQVAITDKILGSRQKGD